MCAYNVQERVRKKRLGESGCAYRAHERRRSPLQKSRRPIRCGPSPPPSGSAAEEPAAQQGERTAAFELVRSPTRHVAEELRLMCHGGRQQAGSRREQRTSEHSPGLSGSQTASRSRATRTEVRVTDALGAHRLAEAVRSTHARSHCAPRGGRAAARAARACGAVQPNAPPLQRAVWA